MNVLDEDIPESQRRILRGWRIRARQIGKEVGRAGMEDEQILPLLLRLPRPTFFSRDHGFFRAANRHPRYCLVVLSVERAETASYVRRFLAHPAFDSWAKRMGAVVEAQASGLRAFRAHRRALATLRWR